jgi:hypothetical protein
MLKNGGQMQDDVAIEDSVPVPLEPQTRRGRPPSFPFLKLLPGQSFFVPGRNLIRVSEWNLRYKDRRWVSRQENGGVRVWRVE